MQLKKFVGLKKLFVRGLFLCGASTLVCQLPVRASQSVTLTWNPTTATNIAGYKIYFGTVSHNYSATNTTGLATNTTISGLVEGQTYYFSASTYDGAGNQSTNSTEVSYVVPGTQLPALSLVTGLTVTANPGVPNSVILSWKASTDAAAGGYQIFSGSASGNFSLSQNVGLVTNLVFTGLAPGSTTYFAMKEFSIGWQNETDMSAEISWVNPVTPATLTSVVRSGKQMSFTVSGVTGSQYVVQASTDLTTWTSVQTNTAPFTFTDTNTAAFKQRFYRACSLAP